MRKQLIVGIDPDIEKSGVAILDTIHDNHVTLYNFTFFELYDKLCAIKNLFGIDHVNKLVVVVEAGWLNEISNYHASKNIKTSNKISKNVGANHQTGKHIVEMCNYLNIVCCIKRPLKKIWSGKDGKITHIELANIIPQIALMGHSTNQEQRDACLIAWDYAGLPIRLLPIKK